MRLCDALLVVGAWCLAAPAGAQPSPRLTDLVDPFVGVDHGGNAVPGAAVPFGFVALSPDTSRSDTAGYSSEGRILGFSHTHVSGTGGESKYGNFRVTPTVGDPGLGNLELDKAEEQAAPGYYAVALQPPGRPRDAVRSELTATRLVGFSRFTFPAAERANVVLDASSRIRLGGNVWHGPDGVPHLQQTATRVAVEIVDATHIEGTASFVGGWNPGPYTLYFYAAFDRPMERSGTWTSDRVPHAQEGSQRAAGCDQRQNYRCQLGAYASFDTRRNRVVQLKLAVSFISLAKARQNLEREAPGWDFDAVRRDAESRWEQALGKLRVEGGTPAQRRIFYTALYRSHFMPHDLTGENAWWQSAEPHYEDYYCLWDTFRTLHPLLTLIQPERQRDMVRSLVDTYVHTGWMPDARIAGSNGMTQGGSNGDVLVADALVKGLKGIDQARAYEALVKNAEVESREPLREGRQLADWKRLGYVSLASPRSASRTMEYAYDDFAVATVARRLGHEADAKKYLERSGNWANLWDAEARCIRPRYPDGRWLENFDCTHEYPDQTTEWWDVPYYEGRPWQYSTYVPHDVAGLIRRVGGDDAFVAWLDAFFERGMYTQGNEPDILAPYLYIHAGRPDRTAQRVRELLDREYHEGRAGLPGNDDAGAMSSWYVWGAIGLYPNAGQPLYYIGSPLFTRAVIDLGGGRTFTVEAPESSQDNRYVWRAELNGKPLERAWLTHEEIAAGGTLTLHLAPKATEWGRQQRPPSVSGQ